MDIKIIVSVLSLLSIYASGQDENAAAPLEINFLNKEERHVNLGDEVDLSYTFNRGLLFPLSKNVELIRIDKDAGGNLVEVVLADFGKLTNGEPEFYSAKYDDVANVQTGPVTVRFHIKKVRNIDDTTFMCKAPDDDGNIVMSKVKVIVLRENEKLEMQFKDSAPFHTSMTQPFEVDAGSYKVKCTAIGSNPATRLIQVFFGGKKVQTSEPVAEEIAGDVKKFRTTAEAMVEIDLKNSGQNVACFAETVSGGQMEVKAPVTVNVYDPAVECTEGTAYVGQRYPKLSCKVDVSGVNVAKYGFQFGPTGAVVYNGEQNNDFDEVKVTDLKDSEVQVDLTIHKTKESHFTEYYLIVEHVNGHITREAVVLKKVEGDANNAGSVEGGPKDGSIKLQGSILALIICSVLALWKSS